MVIDRENSCIMIVTFLRSYPIKLTDMCTLAVDSLNDW